MRKTDILIAGGGLAGSTAAAALGRAGRATMLVDPHAVYPPDFRAEKLDGTQVAILRRTGVGDAVLRTATHDGETWIARFSRLLERRPGDQHGILYDAMVNASASPQCSASSPSSSASRRRITSQLNGLAPTQGRSASGTSVNG